MPKNEITREIIEQMMRDSAAIALIIMDEQLESFVSRLRKRGSPSLSMIEHRILQRSGVTGGAVDMSIVNRVALDPRELHPYACAKRIILNAQAIDSQLRSMGNEQGSNVKIDSMKEV